MEIFESRKTSKYLQGRTEKKKREFFELWTISSLAKSISKWATEKNLRVVVEVFRVVLPTSYGDFRIIEIRIAVIRITVFDACTYVSTWLFLRLFLLLPLAGTRLMYGRCMLFLLLWAAISLGWTDHDICKHGRAARSGNTYGCLA